MRVRFVVAVVALTAVACVSAFAAKPGPKPTVAVQSGQAQFNRAYTLGKSNPIGVTLKDAEFTAQQVAIGERTYFPTSEQKIMVLRFRVQNPQKGKVTFAWNMVSLTAEDSKGAKWEPTQDVAAEGSSKSVYALLKPKQAIDVYTVFLVPSSEQISRLVLKANDGPALRCDLKGKVKPLPDPFVDPKDPSGSTALADVPAGMGVYHPVNYFDLKLDSASYIDTPIAGANVGEDSRTLVLTLTVRNDSATVQNLNSGAFAPRLASSDGATLDWNQVMLKADKDEPLSTQVASGAEAVFRYYWAIPQDTDLKTLTIGDGESRRYVYDMSAVK